MAIHVNVYSNLCGINTSFLLSSSLMDRLIPQFAVYANLTINSIRIPLNFLAAFWIVKKFGRRPLMVLSALLLAICNYSIAIGYLTDSIIQVIVINILFMVVFSILYNPVMFTYPAQIIPAGQYIVAYVFNQAAMALALFVPPLILTAMDGNGFALFIFFGVYSTLSVIYMYFYLKESKGIKYD